MSDQARHKPSRTLVVLSCSSSKNPAPGLLSAIHRYDGPAYRILRSILRDRQWPDDLSVAVLSAKYGLVGGLTEIETYDQRMDEERALALRAASTSSLL